MFTLEPDVESLIRAAMKERGLSFKDVLNSALQAGLAAGKPRRRRFSQRTFSLGSEQNFRWDKALSRRRRVDGGPGTGGNLTCNACSRVIV